ncbi:small ribosomal subunit protein mS27 [Paramormyrops kingsleyae]|uniref:Small ribosomal subunit protein mS27 n=1 Tax=Paramormyrops kingsleyae TaxID=1676925 RepID=A0A3B3Q3E9_9TELE|nr:28S ribosomal protein S27, mitochondrial [Paramormyrops kingsleyae]
MVTLPVRCVIFCPNPSKMALHMLQRCVCLSKCFSKSAMPRFTARRSLLSASYTDPKIWEDKDPDPRNLAELAALMDRTYERKLPVSSLTISRFVDNITSMEEIEQTVYYLYKFRHSPNCWYLRDWTIHSWIRQCLKYGARDKALYTLKNKVQFGIFPDEFTFNLLLDSFLKDKDFGGACSVVEEMMRQEAFDSPSTQILSLYALANYLSTNPELTWQDERNLGASLMIAGLKQQNSTGFSAQVVGHALLGKVEISQGIHAVFRDAPLTWVPGFISRALLVMEQVCDAAPHIKISKEGLDYLEGLLKDLSASHTPEEGGETPETVDEEDQLERMKVPEYSRRFKDLNGRLQALDRIDVRSLQALTSSLAEESLVAAEAQDVQRYQGAMKEWEEERRDLARREEEQREKAQQEWAARAAEKARQPLQKLSRH